MQHIVSIIKHEFYPPRLLINVNDSVIFKNNDNQTQTLVSDSYDSERIKEYQSFERKFTVSGEYKHSLDSNPGVFVKITVGKSVFIPQFTVIEKKVLKEKPWHTPKPLEVRKLEEEKT